MTPSLRCRNALETRSWYLVACAALAACGSTGPPPPSDPGVVHDLGIARHQSVGLSDQRADAIVASMSEVLRVDDGPGDVPCDVEFRRSGSVVAFPDGDGIINSEAELLEVLQLPGEVKVVRQINWCGTFGPGIIGCAPTPGPSLVVVRFDADQEGILWVHEYGHNQGLDHRNDTGAVMNEFIGSDHRRVNTFECQAYE